MKKILKILRKIFKAFEGSDDIIYHEYMDRQKALEEMKDMKAKHRRGG